MLVVVVGNLPRTLQERVAAHTGLCPRQSAAAMFGVGLHDLEFFRRQPAGLEQDLVGNGHFANVVQGCRLGQQVDGIWRQLLSVHRVFAERECQFAHVLLRPPDVVAGVGVPCLGQ